MSTHNNLVRSMLQRANDGVYDCPDAVPNLEERAKNGDFDAKAMLTSLRKINALYPSKLDA